MGNKHICFYTGRTHTHTAYTSHFHIWWKHFQCQFISCILVYVSPIHWWDTHTAKKQQLLSVHLPLGHLSLFQNVAVKPLKLKMYNLYFSASKLIWRLIQTSINFRMLIESNMCNVHVNMNSFKDIIYALILWLLSLHSKIIRIFSAICFWLE